MNSKFEMSESSNNGQSIEEKYYEALQEYDEMRKKKGYMNVGGTHFKGERRKYKQSDYTLKKSKKEFLDNVILWCNNIEINVMLEDGILNRMIISDNYKNGFENIDKDGVENPFNMTHIRPGQNEDNQTSQFGIGMKAGAISTCNKFTVYTRVGNTYWKIIMDFIQMENVKESRFSFDPAKFEITQQEYSHFHPFEYGSTLIFEDIHKNMYETTNMDRICRDLISSTSECYSKIIRSNNINITVNGERVQPQKNYFLEPQCDPFNSIIKLYKIQKTETNVVLEEFIIEELDDDIPVFHRFNKETRKLNKLTENECIKFGLIDITKPKVKKENWKFINSISESQKACLICAGTFMMYHPDLNTNNKELNQSRYPKGRARLFREGRCYGDWDVDATNGMSNFTDIEISFVSKEIANTLGLTWNKNISNEQKNDLCVLVRMLISKIRSKLSGDTASPANLKLYEIARKHNIHVPDSRLPTKIKNPEPRAKPAAPIVTPSTAAPTPAPPAAPTPAPPAAPTPAAKADPAVTKPPTPAAKVDPAPSAKADPAPGPPTPSAKADPTPAKADPTPAKADPTPNPTPAVTNPTPNPTHTPVLKVEKPEFNPKQTVLGSCKHITISRREGKEIIKFMQTHSDHHLYFKEIKEMAIEYLKRFDRDQVKIMFKYIPNDKELYTMLLELIDQYYDNVINNDEILCGSKMFQLFEKYM